MVVNSREGNDQESIQFIPHLPSETSSEAPFLDLNNEYLMVQLCLNFMTNQMTLILIL